MIPATSAEERLLLECAHISIDETGAERIRGAILRCPGTRFAALAERHRVTPLVCKTLERVWPEVLELPEVRVLAERTRFIAARTLQLTQEMLSLVRLLEDNGIAVVPLKGSVLAMAAFGSLSGREFADLDLLVARNDLDRARALLCSTGYKAELELEPGREAAYIRSEHAFTYHNERNQLTVELHWRLHDRYLSFPLSDVDLWANTRVEKIFGTKLNCLKPELNFIFLCMHGAKHSWDRLEWISCLHALICSLPQDGWPAVISEASRLRSTRLLHLGLMLEDHLGASPSTQRPLGLMQPDALVEDLAATVWERMFEDEVNGSTREVHRFRFYLQAKEHLWDRLQVVWNVSVRIPHPNSSAWERTSLPPSFLFLHYLLSPLGFLTKFGWRGLRGILRPRRQLRSSGEWWRENDCGNSEKKTAGCNVSN